MGNEASKNIKQSNMMNLEMADYERSMQTLNIMIQEKDETIKSLQNEISHQEELIQNIKKQLESKENQFVQSEDRGNKLKQLLVKAKKDCADVKKMEGEQKAVEIQLGTQVENMTQQIEDLKMQVAGLISENQNLTINLKNSNDS